MNMRLLDLDPLRRDAVLNAALKEFAAQGFDSASTNVIAKEAGISKGLMFHYVGSKKELFYFVFEFFSDLLKREYFERMNFDERDLFRRLRHSYFLQIKLFEKYPWISELHRLSCSMESIDRDGGDEWAALEESSDCFSDLLDGIDEGMFRNGLDIDKCKQIILWSNIGFTGQILDEIRNGGTGTVNGESIRNRIDGYLDELRKVFYVPDGNQM